MKWTIYKYLDGVTISVQHDELLDGPWQNPDKDEMIIQINSKFYIDEYTEFDKQNS